MAAHTRNKSSEGNLLPPSRAGKDGRSMSSAGSFNPRSGGTSYAGIAPPPGSFSAELRSTATGKGDITRGDYFGAFAGTRAAESAFEDEESQLKQADFREKIEKEVKIKLGTENLLEALNFKSSKQSKEQRKRIENEIDLSNRKIAQLKSHLAAEVKRSADQIAATPSRLSQLFQGQERPSSSRSANHGDDAERETESPTYLLDKTMNFLETSGYPPSYYVEHANTLAELLKRHPALKYELAWSIFGVRIQGMLLSDSRDVAAAGFRAMRYAITDQRSLSIMRSFHTDYFVLLALVKEGKANVEREQALKFVRAFLDVKGGVEELPRQIVRVIVAVAEQADDRLRNICILTLSEMLVRSPSLVASADGIGALTDALGEGLYHPSESLTAAFLYLLESPSRRKYLRSGDELQGPFASFTEGTNSINEQRLKTNARVIANLLKSWSGLITLSMDGFLAIKTLTNSLYVDSTLIRDLILEVLLDILRIKPPSWSTSFLAGRRLTTYGHVASIAFDSNTPAHKDDPDENEREGLVNHFKALLLAVLIQCDLLESLLFTLKHEKDQSIRRKAALLIGEALELANKILPSTWTGRLQVLPHLFDSASILKSESHFVATSIIYQIDSVNRTLYRTGQKSRLHLLDDEPTASARLRRTSDLDRDVFTPDIEENTFKQIVNETQVLSTPKWNKWNWDLVLKIIEGPLLNPRRLDDVIKNNKFIKRTMGFYRPFKFRFCDIRNSKQTQQRYVKAGCSLMRTLLSSGEGIKYLAENKMLRQLAECLAQVDRLSGLTSASPLFSPDRLNNTLTVGYFALLGSISSDPRGLAIMERWRMVNMFYHIVETHSRPDLIRALLSNLNYTLDGHLRVVLSKALTSSPKEIRVFSTRLLRRYATGKSVDDDSKKNTDRAVVEWAVDLLVTQLYDPEIEVCEAAIKILEEACNDVQSLEYVVQCRPALDHLGEIGAPLLLRFLTTSIGYHYLDELDYISQEMDDWFLGRNDAYVTLVEASVAKGLSSAPDSPRGALDESQDEPSFNVTPPHFYRELTRTKEGCRLLESKGHFEEFVHIIQTWGLESSDPETILKVKGSLWAVGNIGSMDLGAPFLESSDIIEHIVRVAEKSDVMSMRGTAFFVLGLISRSVSGQELLAEQGWDSALDPDWFSTGICLPRDLSKLFAVKRWAHQADPSKVEGEPTAAKDRGLHEEDPVNSRILNLVNDLGNTVLAKNRAAELHG